MLVPAQAGQRPRPANPIPADITPRGTGGAVRFSATIDAAPGWEKHYRRRVRTWSSPSPDVLTIHDDYELVYGGSVEFLWQTKLDVRVEGQRIVVRGQRGTVVVTAPTTRPSRWRSYRYTAERYNGASRSAETNQTGVGR